MLVLEINVFWSSSKAEPEAMQEIRDNRSVNLSSSSPIELVRPYIIVPLFYQYFFSLFFNDPSLWGLRDFDDKWGEKHSSKISLNEMEWNG
jgi:hypothetical protein